MNNREGIYLRYNEGKLYDDGKCFIRGDVRAPACVCKFSSHLVLVREPTEPNLYLNLTKRRKKNGNEYFLKPLFKDD